MSKQITLIAKEVSSLVIEDQEGLTTATTYISKVNKIVDKLEEERVKKTGPMNAALKAVNADYQPFIKEGKAIVTSIKDKMVQFRASELLKQEKIAARVAKGTMRIDTAANKLETMNDSASANTVDGSVKFRKTQQLKVTDLTQIPDKYFDLNESLLLKDLKDGTKIAGAEIEIVEIPVNFR